MTMPALITLKLMLPPSASAAVVSETPASASNAIRPARNADAVRMSFCSWGMMCEDANQLIACDHIVRWPSVRLFLLRPYPPAVHIQRLAGHERRVVAGEKRQCADQILRHLDALDRLQAGDGAEFVVHGGKTRARLAHQRARRAGQSRRDRVDGDAVGGDVAGEAAGEADDAAL